MERMEVGIRELRLNLSRYVKRAREGTEVIVTDHGTPVARLTRVPEAEDTYERLIREGVITPARRPRSTRLPPPIEIDGTVSDLVIEDRR